MKFSRCSKILDIFPPALGSWLRPLSSIRGLVERGGTSTVGHVVKGGAAERRYRSDQRGGGRSREQLHERPLEATKATIEATAEVLYDSGIHDIGNSGGRSSYERASW